MDLINKIAERKTLIFVFVFWKIATLVLLGTIINELVFDWRVEFLQSSSLLKSFTNWDAQWYLLIAKEGYGIEKSRAFFPAFPFVVRWLSFGILNPLFTGILLTTVFSFAFGILYYKLGSELLTSPVASVGLVIFIAIPSAFYMSAIYTESLFLLILFAFLWFFLIKKSYWATLLSVMLVFTRGQGFFVPIALAGIFLYELPSAIRSKDYSGLRYLLVVALSFVLGVVVFLFLQWWQFGNAMEFLHIQRKYYGEYFSNSFVNTLNPVHLLEVFFTWPKKLFVRDHSFFDKFFIFVGLALMPVVWKTDKRLFMFYFVLYYFPATMGNGGSFGRFFLLPYSIASLAIANFFVNDVRISDSVKSVLLSGIILVGFFSEAVLCLLFAAYWWIG